MTMTTESTSKDRMLLLIISHLNACPIIESEAQMRLCFILAILFPLYSVTNEDRARNLNTGGKHDTA